MKKRSPPHLLEGKEKKIVPPTAGASRRKNREFWINLYPDNIVCAHTDKKSAVAFSGGKGETIRVREVKTAKRSAKPAGRSRTKGNKLVTPKKGGKNG